MPVLLALFLSLPVFIFSQNKPAEKANELFKLEQYTPAAVHYEEAIAELKKKGKTSRSLLNLQSKLAFCYRVNNRMEEAEEVYAEVVQNERAKAKTFFFYGETLMANGKYEEAKKWFSDYQKLEPEDEKTALMIRACDEVQHIEPYFEYVDVQYFEHNSDADDNAAVMWEDGIVFSSDRTSKSKIKVNILEEKSGWTGRDYLDIYFSKKQSDGSFSRPKQFSSKLSELNKNSGNTSFSLDGSEVFFTRNDNVLNKQKTYNLQLFQAENDNGRWRNVKKLPFCSPNYNFMHPAISPDGKMLFFASNKGSGQGGTDIWVSIRENDGDWSKPENLGPIVNTAANEGFPFMDNFGRLYFCSKGHVGYGGFDIFFTEMTGSGVWKKPVNLGQPVNSPLDDISIYVDAERKSGMFSSSRKGGDDDIFLFKVLDSASVETEEILPLAKVEEEENSKPILNEPIAETTEEQPTQDLPIVAPPVEEEIETPTLDEAPKEFEKEEISEINSSPILEPETFIEDKIAVVEKDFVDSTEITLAPEIEEIAIEEEIEAPEKVDSILVEADSATTSPLSTETIPEPAPPVFENTEETSPIEALSTSEEPIVLEETAAEFALSSFQDFTEKATKGALAEGERFRLDKAVFDPNIWQLTPKVSKQLDELAAIMRRFPDLKIELSSHTESLGANERNLRLSQNRADTAVEYLLREGIPSERLTAVGYGETMPLNKCRDGVTCSLDEHHFNQRLEVKILTPEKGQ